LPEAAHALQVLHVKASEISPPQLQYLRKWPQQVPALVAVVLDNTQLGKDRGTACDDPVHTDKAIQVLVPACQYNVREMPWVRRGEGRVWEGVHNSARQRKAIGWLK